LPHTRIGECTQFSTEAIFQILHRICSTLKQRILHHRNDLRPRPGFRRPLLENLAREYNSKLEQELQPLERVIIEATSSPVPVTLKRKRMSTDASNGQEDPSSMEEDGSTNGVTLPVPPNGSKRTRGTLEQPHRPESPFKVSFKVQMAKARLDLKVIQAVDVDSFKNDRDLIKARAEYLAQLARPLLDAVLNTDVPTVSLIITNNT
jgi:hypothetical protein